MFRSHLESGSLGEAPAADALPSVTTSNSVPAPVPASNAFMSRLLLVGGVALVVFLILRAMNKGKKADA